MYSIKNQVMREKMSAFEITKEDIEILDPHKFTQLMKKLIRAELTKLGLKQTELTISLDISSDSIVSYALDFGIDCFHLINFKK